MSATPAEITELRRQLWEAQGNGNYDTVSDIEELLACHDPVHAGRYTYQQYVLVPLAQDPYYEQMVASGSITVVDPPLTTPAPVPPVPPPVASFTSVPPNPGAAQDTTFVATSSTPGSSQYPLTSWDWVFNTTMTGSGQFVSWRTPADPGSYPVVLTVTAADGQQNSATMTIVIPDAAQLQPNTPATTGTTSAAKAPVTDQPAAMEAKAPAKQQQGRRAGGPRTA